MTIIELESELEKQASAVLSSVYVQPAFEGDKNAQRFLMRLWGEKWSSIKKKLETEGSSWYVWWIDGVRKFIWKHRVVLRKEGFEI